MLKGKSPHEVLYGKEPKIDHLRVFGCLRFASVLPKQDKFDPRARKVILMGYSETQRVYRVMDLESHQFYVCMDTTFMEHVFPFKKEVTAETYDNYIHPLLYPPTHLKGDGPYHITSTVPDITHTVETISVEHML